MLITVHNVETNEIVQREMNADETLQYEQDQAKAITEAADKAAARQAIFDRLGITAEEAAVLGL